MADLIPMSPALDALVNAASKAKSTPTTTTTTTTTTITHSSMPLASTTATLSDVSPLHHTRSLQTSYTPHQTSQSSLTGMSILKLSTSRDSDARNGITHTSSTPSPLRPPTRSPSMLSRTPFPLLSPSSSPPSSTTTLSSITSNMTPLSSLAASKLGHMRRRASVSVYDPSHMNKRPRTSSFTSPMISTPTSLIPSTPRSSPPLPPTHATYHSLTQAAVTVSQQDINEPEQEDVDVDDMDDMDDDSEESPPYSPQHHKKKLNAQQQAAQAAQAASQHDAGGSSCHQCKSRRSFIDLTYCTSNLNKKNKNAVCRKKYCEHCLKKFYKEVPAPANQSKTWKCPSCRKICCCAACRRREQRDHDDSAPVSARGTPTMSPVSQHRHIQDPMFSPTTTTHHSTPSQGSMSSPPVPPRTISTRPHSQRPSTSQFARPLVSSPPSTSTSTPSSPKQSSIVTNNDVVIKLEVVSTNDDTSHELRPSSSSSTQSIHPSTTTSTSTINGDHDGDGESESSDNVEREKKESKSTDTNPSSSSSSSSSHHDRESFFLLYAVGQLPHIQMTVRDIMGRTEQTMKQKLNAIAEVFDRVIQDTGDTEKQTQLLVTV